MDQDPSRDALGHDTTDGGYHLERAEGWEERLTAHKRFVEDSDQE